MDVYIPCVINQEEDMLGISMAQGQHFKSDILINTNVTSNPRNRAVSQIFAEKQTNEHLVL